MSLRVNIQTKAKDIGELLEAIRKILMEYPTQRWNFDLDLYVAKKDC